ncbi:Cyanide insensitive terminal oxidase, putative subunit III [Pseudomonas sp. BAY1663]|jgi:hypothetical protein|uniref:DUF2474 domain-containing protein n=1 Tax=Stutzerimonas stutzeri TaxID=316 RepID=A0A2N8T526_STUST|nr:MULTISPECIES: DUF2474 domain-containing protein [Pseudomonadaceae]EXF47153.1 Cyanide insensitive terminal oxidase, putative subunit III [Pseudomonas sp. BAY1663]MCQ4325238.1 DUF2474 domain-containing protein [Stutzerimonas stutzeri]PNG09867.1 DUF2474 domain-containing protein [Stutzerimonas stutzeri]
MKDGNEPQQKPLWQRMSWLVLIWSGSVLALAVVAWLLRLAMNAAGLAAP